MRRWFLLGLATVACGRLGFQPVTDGEVAPGDGALADGALADGGPGDGGLVDGANAACPVAQPTCGVPGCTADLSCPYTDGTCCTCDGIQWICLAPNPPECPTIKPLLGTGCGIADLQCGYCETAPVVCKDNMWQVGGAPC